MGQAKYEVYNIQRLSEDFGGLLLGNMVGKYALILELSP
jgi:hypothetical protein